MNNHKILHGGSKRNLGWCTALSFGWALSLVLPHFQLESNGYMLILDMFLVALLFLLLTETQKLTGRLLKIGLVLVAFGGFLISYIASFAIDSKYYDFWSHLGSGTMKLQGKVKIFGDLEHLTSAAKCKVPVIIGENICDPWGRRFNQNPQVIKFMQLTSLTNLQMVGLVSILIFLIVIYCGISNLKIKNAGIYLFLAMPPVILAVDRGNELITISLILVGYYELEKESHTSQAVGGFLLLLATCFKIWPVFIVVALLFTKWGKLKLLNKLLLFTSPLYWIINQAKIFQILHATQSGSPFGTSFGLRLFFHSGIDSTRLIILVMFAFVFFAFLVRAGRTHFDSFISASRGMQALLRIAPFLFCYLAIWLIGDNFLYRMVVFIPIILILSSFYYMDFVWPNFMIVAILVTALSSRLPIALAVSSTLALYFLYVLIQILRRSIPLFKTGNLSIK